MLIDRGNLPNSIQYTGLKQVDSVGGEGQTSLETVGGTTSRSQKAPSYQGYPGSKRGRGGSAYSSYGKLPRLGSYTGGGYNRKKGYGTVGRGGRGIGSRMYSRPNLQKKRYEIPAYLKEKLAGSNRRTGSSINDRQNHSQNLSYKRKLHNAIYDRNRTFQPRISGRPPQQRNYSKGNTNSFNYRSQPTLKRDYAKRKKIAYSNLKNDPYVQRQTANLRMDPSDRKIDPGYIRPDALRLLKQKR